MTYCSIFRRTPFAVGIFLAAICLEGQSSVFRSIVPGYGFVAQTSTNGVISRVYLSGSKDIVCLDGRSGHVIWSEKIPGGSVNVGPVIVGSTLVYMGGGGFFTAYGLDIKNGRTKWTLEKRSPALSSGPGTVFLSTQGGLGVIAVNASNGQIKWERRPARVGGTLMHIVFSKGRLYTDSPYVWRASSGQLINKLGFDPRVVAAHSGRVYMTGPDLQLFAMDAATGNILWKALNPVPESKETTPDEYLAASTKYFVAAFYNDQAFIAHHGLVRVYNAATGKLLWGNELISTAGLEPNLIGVDNEFVYLLEPNSKNSDGSNIIAFNAITGKRIWKFSSPTERIDGPVASIGDTIFVSGEGPGPNHTALYAIDRKNGKLQWKFSF